MLRKLIFAGLLMLLPTAWLLWQYLPLPLPEQWTPAEVQLLQSLSLSRLENPPADPSNRFSEDPEAARLGHRLFFDRRLSRNGAVACANCHQPALGFSDGMALGTGLATGDRHTMGLPGVAYGAWHYWDGRKDSLWSQALEPLENPLEQATSRTDLARLISTDPLYRDAFAQRLGPLADFSDESRFPPGATPLGDKRQQHSWAAMSEADRTAVNTVFASLGKFLAAYERLLQPGPAAFDRYADSLTEDGSLRADGSLTRSQLAGLRLFIGKAQCVNCHNGPLFSNQDFHNTGLLSAAGQLPALGRSVGLAAAQRDEFNCQGRYSDAGLNDCQELRFARTGDENLGAMKTPGLRNVAVTAPYMHAGQLTSLAEVLRHYDAALPAMVGHNEAEPLGLRAIERRQLESFLHSLTAPLATDSAWLQAPAP